MLGAARDPKPCDCLEALDDGIPDGGLHYGRLDVRPQDRAGVCDQLTRVARPTLSHATATTTNCHRLPTCVTLNQMMSGWIAEARDTLAFRVGQWEKVSEKLHDDGQTLTCEPAPQHSAH